MSYLITEPSHLNYRNKSYSIYRARKIHICDAVMYGILQSVNPNKGYEEADVCKNIMPLFSVIALP